MNIGDISISISGPGLVVDHSVALIEKVLKDAGYIINLTCTDDEYELDREELLKQTAITNQTAFIKVKPLPWGG